MRVHTRALACMCASTRQPTSLLRSLLLLFEDGVHSAFLVLLLPPRLLSHLPHRRVNLLLLRLSLPSAQRVLARNGAGCSDGSMSSFQRNFVRACVRACVYACVCACVRAFVCVFAFACLCLSFSLPDLASSSARFLSSASRCSSARRCSSSFRAASSRSRRWAAWPSVCVCARRVV